MRDRLSIKEEDLLDLSIEKKMLNLKLKRLKDYKEIVQIIEKLYQIDVDLDNNQKSLEKK